MNYGYREQHSQCYFHPDEELVGVCAQCLNQRLFLLASKKPHLRNSWGRNSCRSSSHSHPSTGHCRKPSVTHSKIFTFISLLNRLEFRHRKSEISDHETASTTSLEDSFISMKLEENGVASWEKNKVSNNTNKVTLESCSMAWNHYNLAKSETTKSVIEQGKSRTTLRWRKRIGQLIRWKRSNKAAVCQVGSKVDGVKVRKVWIRTLTTK